MTGGQASGFLKLRRLLVARRAYWTIGALISVSAAALIGRMQISPATTVVSTPTLFNPPEAIRDADPSRTPTVVATNSPTTAPTPIIPATDPSSPDATVELVEPYSIESVAPPPALGIQRLYIANLGWPVEQTPVYPSGLRVPGEHLRPDTGRYGEIRGTWRLTHLGSDYLDPGEDDLLPPAETAILAAAVYLERSTYTAIAVDMSGNIQMYLVTLRTSDGVRSYLIGYAHLRHGSNEQAIDQAQANGGYVSVMGKVDIVNADNPNLSDMHIGVIDIIDLLRFTGQNNLHDALVELFSDRLPRTNQQYPDIFERPEDIFPALEFLLERYVEPPIAGGTPPE